MADQNGRTGNDVIDTVLGEAWAFDFFRVIRRLELTLSAAASIGRNGPSVDEVVSIRPEASLRFPPSAIANIETGTDRKFPLLMTITFFGLYGRYGTLPWHYTSRIIHQERPSIADTRYPRSGLRAFIDILNHRFASLFYRAGIKYNWPLTFRQNGEDEITRNFIAFTGLKTLHVSNKIGLPDIALLRYAGLFLVPNSASSLTSLLSDFLNTPVKIKQFEGEWLQIEEVDRNRIGFRKGNNRLGHTFTLGRRIFSRQHRFRIVIGPVGYDQFKQLQPGHKKFEQIDTIVRMRSGAAMKFDCVIKIDRQTATPTTLGRKNAVLGRTFFLLSKNKLGPIACPVFKSETSIPHPETLEMQGTEAEGRLLYV
ncbi:MAG TPA: type VI secretion system baseplate subunit TssG [Chitinispirillaceae bacterium]|nr:type VI secretion system baseplate subunit TssG [Chitinispirillaceae bacterium]